MNNQNYYNNRQLYAGSRYRISLVKSNKILDLCEKLISCKLWEILCTNSLSTSYVFLM